MSILKEMLELNEAQLNEAKVNWKSGEDKTEFATYKGHKLEVKFETGSGRDKTKHFDQHYVGTIDGKEVDVRHASRYGEKGRVMNALKNEVDHMHVGETEPGTTPAKMLEYLKASLGHTKLNGWDWDHAAPGDLMGKNKSKCITVQLDKTVRAQKEWTGKHTPGNHRFMIQATYSTEEGAKHDLATIWLAQAGQIITVGIPNAKFKHGDLSSFIRAIKKLADTSDEELITHLYKSGYHQYGRA